MGNRKDNLVMKKSYVFALDVIKLYKFLSIEKKEFVLSMQLTRSGTAVGALIKEAEHAQSKADFLNKMNIALKEANESEYWVELMKDSNYINEEIANKYLEDVSSLIKLLASIVKTTKSKLTR